MTPVILAKTTEKVVFPSADMERAEDREGLEGRSEVEFWVC